MANIEETIQKMTLAGAGNARSVPDGDQFKIEIKRGGVWQPAIFGITESVANDMLKRAANRTILG